jgi:hypothetical protein
MDQRMGQPRDLLLSSRKKLELLKEVSFGRKVSLARQSLPHLCKRNERRPFQMVTGGSAGRLAKRRIPQRLRVKVHVSAYHGDLLEHRQRYGDAVLHQR